MACKKHPKYEGKRMPGVNCLDCWKVRNDKLMADLEKMSEDFKKFMVRYKEMEEAIDGEMLQA